MSIWNRNKRDGVATLSTVLVVCSILVIISVIGAIISVALLGSTLNERLAAESLFAARTGAEDAIIRVIRYKNCSFSGCPYSYSLEVGVNSTDIEIEGTGGAITITSIGMAGNRRKKIEVNATVNQSTGEFKIQSFKEVPL